MRQPKILVLTGRALACRYFEERGVLISSPGLIMRNYLRNGFVLHALTALPMELLTRVLLKVSTRVPLCIGTIICVPARTSANPIAAQVLGYHFVLARSFDYYCAAHGAPHARPAEGPPPPLKT